MGAVGVVRHDMMPGSTRYNDDENKEAELRDTRSQAIRIGSPVGVGGLRKTKEEEMTPSLNHWVDGNAAIIYT